MEETSPQPRWSRPLGLQVARPNVGYCRQLVDFEKTSTGWAAWLGAWSTWRLLENHEAYKKIGGICSNGWFSIVICEFSRVYGHIQLRWGHFCVLDVLKMKFQSDLLRVFVFRGGEISPIHFLSFVMIHPDL